MLQRIRGNKGAQLGIGLVLGVAFGFLLQKGGATEYDVIIGQLLLVDFTVLKIMLAAAITGMVLVYASRSLGWVHLHPKSGSVGTSIAGGLVFGVAFAVLGYCPGTAVGAVGQGSLDALFGGIPGILIGSGLYAVLYPRMLKSVLMVGDCGTLTLPELLKVNPWVVVLPAAILLTAVLFLFEVAGL
jgi:hypothetical protein